MTTQFWGLVAENGRRYQQKVDRGFHITMATLEPAGMGAPNSRYDDKPVHVMVEYDKTSYILCTLWFKENTIQAPLNIRFATGEQLEIYILGGSPKTKVHLTGFHSDAVSTSTTDNGVERQSILVSSESKAKDRAKKRVSIHEEVKIKRFDNDEEEDEDDDDEDDDDYDEEDDELEFDDESETLLGMMNGKLDVDDEFEIDDDDSDENNEDQVPTKEKKSGDTKIAKPLSSDKTKTVTIGSDEEDDEDDSSDDDDDSDEDDDDIEMGSVTPTQTKPLKNKVLEALKTPESKKSKKSQQEMKTPENQNIKTKSPSSAGHTPMKSIYKGGMMIQELKIGNGTPAKSGKMVGVYYTGRLKSNNSQFDSNTSGPGFKFRLGKGEVIKGWDIGVEGMKVGGKRRIIVPSHMAYGKKGAPPDIPPNSTLSFDIEVKSVS